MAQRSIGIRRYVAKQDKAGAKQLEKELEAAFKDMALESERDVEKICRFAEKLITILAPKGDPADASDLAGSVRMGVGRDDKGFHADIVIGEFHWRFHEYGTVHEPPRPFVRPAIEVAVANYQKTRK